MRGGGEIIWCGWAVIPPNEGEAAKMAGGAANLPKWQAEQILCQISPSKYCAKQKYLCGEKFINSSRIDNADMKCRIEVSPQEKRHV